MSRGKKAFRDRMRTLSEADLLSFFDAGLNTLEKLCEIYDGGYAPIAFTMATEVHKILTENNAAVKLRRTRLFSTLIDDHDENVLTAIHKLTGASIEGSPPKLSFVPRFYLPEFPIEKIEMLYFREWWNKDIIYRASAATKGTPLGMIPVNGSPALPYSKREKITRRQLVSLLRNEVGAHQTKEMPILLDELQSSNVWGSFAVQTPDGMLSTDDGTLITKVGPLPAMMRQIAHELLVAYERDDLPPQEE